MRSPNRVHAPGGYGTDYTLCGLAQDAFDTGDADEPVVVAQAGELVTCEYCHSVIDHVRATFTALYRVRHA